MERTSVTREGIVMNRLITRLQRRSRVAVGSTMALIVSLPLGATIGLASTATAAPSPEPAAATDIQAKKALQGTGKAGKAESASTLGDAVPWTADPKASAAAAAEESFDALLFSKTAAFRHSNIDEATTAIQALAADNNFTVTATEDSSAFNDANLAQYEVVIFLSTTGDVLNPCEQAAFERYIQAGGGYAGIHAASDTEYDWPWYGSLVGAYFNNHPPGTPTATVKVEDPAHPSTAGIQTAAGVVDSDCKATLTPSFEKVALDENTSNPMELTIADDGRVFYIDRNGAVRIIKENGSVLTAGTVPVYTGQEFGLLGIALDPDFATNNWVYLYYSPTGSESIDRISRYTMSGDTLQLSTATTILDVPTQRNECCHAGASMEFDNEGN